MYVCVSPYRQCERIWPACPFAIVCPCVRFLVCPSAWPFVSVSVSVFVSVCVPMSESASESVSATGLFASAFSCACVYVECRVHLPACLLSACLLSDRLPVCCLFVYLSAVCCLFVCLSAVCTSISQPQSPLNCVSAWPRGRRVRADSRVQRPATGAGSGASLGRGSPSVRRSVAARPSGGEAARCSPVPQRGGSIRIGTKTPLFSTRPRLERSLQSCHFNQSS